MKTNNLIQAGIVFLSLTCSVLTFAQSVHTQVYDAQTAIAKQDWLTAETILSQANQANPNNPYVLYEMAQVYENTNRPEEAKTIYQNFSKMSDAQLNEYIILVRSTSGVQTTNLAELTPISLARIATKQAADKQATTAAAITPLPISPPTVTPLPPAPVLPVTTTVPPSTGPSVNAEVTTAVQNWAIAWANKDMPAYFSSFVADFKGDQKSAAAWKQAQVSNITKRKLIALDLTEVRITPLSETKTLVHFKLLNTSDNFKQKSQKTLLLTKMNNSWLIEKETTQ